LKNAKERQEQIAKEHGNELETTLNDEKKYSPHAGAGQTNAEKESAKEATQKSKNCENTRINLTPSFSIGHGYYHWSITRCSNSETHRAI
jgi:protein-disulfide isomerase